MRCFVAGLVAVAAAVWMAVAVDRGVWAAVRAPSASKDRYVRYVDPAGWSLGYPKGMHVERSSAQLRISVSEVTIASFGARRAVHSGRSWLRVDPPLDAQGKFPSAGAALRIVSQEGGPGPDLELPETRLPLRIADFRASDAYANVGPRPLRRVVVADGRNYTAFAWIGRGASAPLRATLERVIASLSFPPLRPGEVVGYGFTVFRRSSSYPLPSFTRVQAQGQPFYLVHAPGGFYAVGWRWQTLAGGYKSRCDLELNARRHQFFCTNLSARWDRVGRVLARPRNASRGDPLNLAVAKVAWDGHVMLEPGVARFADARLARQLWPG